MQTTEAVIDIDYEFYNDILKFLFQRDLKNAECLKVVAALFEILAPFETPFGAIVYNFW